MKHGGLLHRLRLYLSDGMYEPLIEADAPDWLYALLERGVERPTQTNLCRMFSHQPFRDMCNRPEHDRCSWCRRSMPGAAEPIGGRT